MESFSALEAIVVEYNKNTQEIVDMFYHSGVDADQEIHLHYIVGLG